MSEQKANEQLGKRLAEMADEARMRAARDAPRPRCDCCGADVELYAELYAEGDCWLCVDAVACQARLVADLDEGEIDWRGIPY